MANSRIYFKNEAGGTTVISRDTTSTSGNLVLPASGNVVSVDAAVTDNAIARYDSTTGKLQNSAITIDDSGNIGSGTQSFNGFGGSGFKNYIINGGFNVNQYPAFSNSSDGYKFDRWGISAGTTFNTMSQIQLNGESSSNKALSFTKISNLTSWIWTNIEFPRILAGKTVTLSFRAYSNTGHDMPSVVYFDKYNPTDGFTNATTGQTFTWNNSWSKRTMTFTLPTLGTNFNNDNSYFQLNFSMTGTTTGAYLTDVQLEEGSIATPFEQRPYGLELSMCQRYYESIQVNNLFYGVAGMNWQLSVPYKAAKRVNPTVVVSTPTGHTNIGTITTVGNNTIVSIAQGTVVATGQVSLNTGLTASAEL